MKESQVLGVCFITAEKGRSSEGGANPTSDRRGRDHILILAGVGHRFTARHSLTEVYEGLTGHSLIELCEGTTSISIGRGMRAPSVLLTVDGNSQLSHRRRRSPH